MSFIHYSHTCSNAAYDAGMTYDRGSGPYRDGTPVCSSDLWQKVTNESWPQRDKKGGHARDIWPVPVDKIIPVTVRLVFQHDGETFLEGHADRWNRSHVHVSLNDERLQINGAWVLAQDVRRRLP